MYINTERDLTIGASVTRDTFHMNSNAVSDSTQKVQHDLVSIVMPAYNSGRFIEKSILSVIEQSYTHWELIIVDDGSSDNTLDIIRSFDDKRIVCLVNPQNMGVSLSRNKALSEAKGQWIAFLDSDDQWKDQKLERQLTLLKESKACLSFTSSSFINESDRMYPGISQVPKQINFKKLLLHNCIACSSVVVQAQSIAGLYFDNDRISEDYAMWLKILKNGNVAVGINEPLLIYRLYANSRSGNKIKSLLRGYRVYRSLGISVFSSALYISSHLFHSIRKYRSIYK